LSLLDQCNLWYWRLDFWAVAVQFFLMAVAGWYAWETRRLRKEQAAQHKLQMSVLVKQDRLRLSTYLAPKLIEYGRLGSVIDRGYITNDIDGWAEVDYWKGWLGNRGLTIFNYCLIDNCGDSNAYDVVVCLANNEGFYISPRSSFVLRKDKQSIHPIANKKFNYDETINFVSEYYGKSLISEFIEMKDVAPPWVMVVYSDIEDNIYRSLMKISVKENGEILGHFRGRRYCGVRTNSPSGEKLLELAFPMHPSASG